MKKILAQDKTYYAFIIFFSCLLLGFFLRHIYSVNTVFELVDEYGYLANAEYLAKGKWGCKLAGYYGYGYSLLLISLFFLVLVRKWGDRQLNQMSNSPLILTSRFV